MTDTTTTPPISETVENYLRFWSAGPGDEQRALGNQVFDPDVRYRAPLGERDGLDSLLSLAREFADQLGALTMTARAEPDIHHEYARLPWVLTRGGAHFAEGTDILSFDAVGRVTAVTTFVDQPPAGFDPHAAH
jgi:hypothetical protein